MSSPSPLHPPESVRRFTSVKIGIVLLLLLLLAFCGVRHEADDSASQQPLAESGADASSPSPTGQVTEAVPLPVPGGSAQQEQQAQPADSAGAAPSQADASGQSGKPADPQGASRQSAESRGSALKPATGDAMIELPTPLAFSLQNDPNGGMRLKGEVPDDTTRDHWMNDARLGARGVEVSGDLRLGRVDPASAALWEGRLSPLVAVVRERAVSELRVRGEVIELYGQAASQQEADETLNLIRAQVPESYRVVPRFGQRTASSAVAQGAEQAAAAAASQSGRERAQGGATGAAGSASQSSSRSAAATNTKQAAARQRPGNCPASVRSLAGSVYFDSGASMPTAAERRRLRRLGACLANNARLRLTGHADSSHTASYNKSLSERRARSVANEIARGGFPSARIIIIAAGQQRASRQKQRSEKAMRQSRRVDIRVN
ncbi:MAG: OmpA family protein [Lautropia sp.]|nr:OmpA family protein [Lautropia sp.]